MKKRKIIQLWTWLSIALTLCTYNRRAAAQPLDTATVSELLHYLSGRNEVMGSLAITKNGKPIYSRAFGYRLISDEQKIVADPDTKYRIWSITKMFTATMVLQLIEEGKVQLESKLAGFFPEIKNSELITIREMLSHKSGIHDFTQPDPHGAPAPEGQQQSDMIRYIAQFNPDFQPGEKFQYSNSNYLLLGYIVERLHGATYADALYKRIASRIGLSDTYYGVGSLDTVENKSLSYQFVKEKWVEVEEGEFSSAVPGGAGSIVSTPGDMSKFIYSLFTGKLLSHESLSQMTDIEEFYGLGLFLMPYNQHVGYGHTGGYLASKSLLTYYPKDSLAIAYCTNGQVYEMENLVSQVCAIYFNKDYVLRHKRPQINLAEQDLLKYVGAYQAPQFVVHIQYENGHLTAQPEGRPKVMLFATKANLFFIREADIEIEFPSDNTASCDRLLILQGGNKMEAKRIGK